MLGFLAGVVSTVVLFPVAFGQLEAAALGEGLEFSIPALVASVATATVCMLGAGALAARGAGAGPWKVRSANGAVAGLVAGCLVFVLVTAPCIGVAGQQGVFRAVDRGLHGATLVGPILAAAVLELTWFFHLSMWLTLGIAVALGALGAAVAGKRGDFTRPPLFALHSGNALAVLIVGSAALPWIIGSSSTLGDGLVQKIPPVTVWDWLPHLVAAFAPTLSLFTVLSAAMLWLWWGIALRWNRAGPGGHSSAVLLAGAALISLQAPFLATVIGAPQFLTRPAFALGAVCFVTTTLLGGHAALHAGKPHPDSGDPLSRPSVLGSVSASLLFSTTLVATVLGPGGLSFGLSVTLGGIHYIPALTDGLANHPDLRTLRETAIEIHTIHAVLSLPLLVMIAISAFLGRSFSFIAQRMVNAYTQRTPR